MIAKNRIRPTRNIFLVMNQTMGRKQFPSAISKVITSVEDLKTSMAVATKYSLWICHDKYLTLSLLRSVSWPSPSLGDAVFLHSMLPQSLPTVANCFTRFAYLARAGFLPITELTDALCAVNKADLFIGGTVDHDSKTVTFWRGNFQTITVSMTSFEKSGDGTVPDFSKLLITDGGQSVQLGKYEAAVSAILYEFDPEYRRRIGKLRERNEQSFGASLRRLRKQKGLKRDDFSPNISSKTIARIELGHVTQIRPKTLGLLAKRLGVKVEEIGQF